MKKGISILAVIIVIIIISTIYMTALTAPVGQNDEHLRLYEFLDEMEMSFDEYISLTQEFAESGIYLYYLDYNASRYEAYQEEYPDLPESTVYAYVNARADIAFYTDIQDVPNLSDVYMLVNKHHRLPADWFSDDLVDIGFGHKMREEAAENFLSLKNDMAKAGLSLQVISTYRPYATSLNRHRNAVAERGLALADSNFARAGHSEHQTGLAIDVLHIAHSGPLSRARFQDSRQFKWFQENGHNYGFILRYPAGLTHIHGYIFEPWHWRYVGVEIATLMHNEGILVYEELYGKYLASDVLHNVRAHILEERAIAEALAEAEESERLEREALENERLRMEALQAAEAERLAHQEAAESEQAIAAAFDTITETDDSAQAEEFRFGEIVILLGICASIASVAIVGYVVYRMRKN